MNHHIHELLRSDPFRHIMTLKVLSLYPSDVKTELLERDSGWALRTLLPVSVSRYDRVAYPDEQQLLAIDGDDRDLKRHLLETTPRVPTILKTYDYDLERQALSSLAAQPITSFLSFTVDAARTPPAQGDLYVEQGHQLSDEVLELFAGNGYEPAELRTYISDGGCWFGLKSAGRIRSICLVYQNYEQIWEIAGVYTPWAERRRGYAKRVVLTALNYLLSKRLTPRYAVKEDNLASIQLAAGLGLVEELRIKHFRIN